MMIIRVICRCGVVLVDPHGAEAVRLALDTVLPMECPHCGEKSTVEIRERREEAEEPAAAGRLAGRGDGSRGAVEERR